MLRLQELHRPSYACPHHPMCLLSSGECILRAVLDQAGTAFSQHRRNRAWKGARKFPSVGWEDGGKQSPPSKKPAFLLAVRCCTCNDSPESVESPLQNGNTLLNGGSRLHGLDFASIQIVP